jgi:hypothetical protein
MAINAKLQTLINIKNDIGTAITNKGGTITSETPFFNYASEINNISTGTPQTVFQDSTGAKWALTNAVNLTNVSNNVTSDFNWWQPANNTTSDAIMNVGTVSANISGNIRIVTVNQVNVSQHNNIVATDVNGNKYIGYNGYDYFTNPNPTGNNNYNRWILKNDATQKVVFQNAIMSVLGNYNSSTIVVNQSVILFNTSNLTNLYNTITAIAMDNDFLYVGGYVNNSTSLVRKYNNNFGYVGQTNFYISAPSSGTIRRVLVDENHIYAAGDGAVVKKWDKNTFSYVGVSQNFGGDVTALGVEGNNLYVGSYDRISVLNKQTLSLITNFPSNLPGRPAHIMFDSVYIYVHTSSPSPGNIKKYWKSNLGFIGNTSSSYAINTSGKIVEQDFSYLYAFSGSNLVRFSKSTLVADSVLPTNESSNSSLIKDNNYLYATGSTVRKFSYPALSYVGTTNVTRPSNLAVVSNNFIYFSNTGVSDKNLFKYQTFAEQPAVENVFTITKIKE